MITPRGIGMVVAAVALFFLAGATRVGWLFLFDAVLWGVIAVSAVMPWLAVGRLQGRRRLNSWYRMGDLPGPMEGHPLELSLRLTNRGVLPAVFVGASHDCGGRTADGRHERIFAAWLGRKQSAEGSMGVVMERRGVHVLPPVRAETSVPFGLFRRRKSVGGSLELVVLPRIYPLERLDSLGSEGAAVSPVSARWGDQVIGSRDHAPGDPLRSVHWRNTARTMQPQTKEYEQSAGSAMTIVFGLPRERRGANEALEDGLRIAASIGDRVCRTGGAVRLLTDHLDMETSDRHQVLMQLALMRNPERSVLPALLGLVSVLTDVTAIVMDTDSAGIESVARLAHRQRRVIVAVMRGFDEAHIPSDPAAGLREAGATVLECWPGRAAEALAPFRALVQPRNGPPDIQSLSYDLRTRVMRRKALSVSSRQ